MKLANCRRCKRLAAHLKITSQQYPDYYCKPVPAFGDPNARLLIVGLAPGLHGANASGIPFTGDASGEFLFAALLRFGFLDDSRQGDRQQPSLKNCRITNAVKCLPPQNKPTTDEIKNCGRTHLKAELACLRENALIMALGKIAHDAVLRAFEFKLTKFTFAHGRLHDLKNGFHLLDSYHCSRYNTQTKRLTNDMFDAVFQQANQYLSLSKLSASEALTAVDEQRDE